MKKLLIAVLCLVMLVGCQKQRDGIPVYGMNKVIEQDKAPWTWRIKVTSVKVDKSYDYPIEDKQAILVTFDVETIDDRKSLSPNNFELYSDGEKLEDTSYGKAFSSSDEADYYVWIEEHSKKTFTFGYVVDPDINSCEIRFAYCRGCESNFIIDLKW